jgi:hypothetical protein
MNKQKFSSKNEFKQKKYSRTSFIVKFSPNVFKDFSAKFLVGTQQQPQNMSHKQSHWAVLIIILHLT